MKQLIFIIVISATGLIGCSSITTSEAPRKRKNIFIPISNRFPFTEHSNVQRVAGRFTNKYETYDSMREEAEGLTLVSIKSEALNTDIKLLSLGSVQHTPYSDKDVETYTISVMQESRRLVCHLGTKLFSKNYMNELIESNQKSIEKYYPKRRNKAYTNLERRGITTHKNNYHFKETMFLSNFGGRFIMINLKMIEVDLKKPVKNFNKVFCYHVGMGLRETLFKMAGDLEDQLMKL